VLICCLGPEGRPAKRQPSPEGLGHQMAKMAERRRCGTFWVLYMTHTSQRRLNLSKPTALLPQPDFPMIGRATNLSRKINATESTNQLIWTAPERLREKLSNEGHGFSRAVIGCALDGFSR
jgi:hypothetical protein